MIERFATWATRWTGSTSAFVLAAASIVVWLVSGPLFRWSDTWQLVANTVTTVITFLMVFLIQRTQNKDSMALQLKLNEIVAVAPLKSYRCATSLRAWFSALSTSAKSIVDVTSNEETSAMQPF